MTATLLLSDDQMTTDAPLHQHYTGQSRPQPAHLEIDPRSGDCCYGVSYEIGNGIRKRVYDGDLIEIAVPGTLCGDRLVDAFEMVRPLVDRVIAGWSADGGMTNDAQNGAQEIADRYAGLAVDADWCWHFSDADDYLRDYDAGVYIENVEAEVDSIIAEAKSDGVLLTGDVDAVLRDKIDAATDGRKAAAESRDAYGRD